MWKGILVGGLIRLVVMKVDLVVLEVAARGGKPPRPQCRKAPQAALAVLGEARIMPDLSGRAMGEPQRRRGVMGVRKALSANRKRMPRTGVGPRNDGMASARPKTAPDWP